MTRVNIPSPRRLARRLRDVIANARGTALLEFALCFPLILLTGGYGVELSGLALCNLRISQYALQMADNASRIGVNNGLAVYQVRERDISDILQVARLSERGLKLTTYGRITLSSLENVQQSYDSAPVQRIHWQRCLGMKSGASYDSSYGATTSAAGSTANMADAGTASPNGLGDAGAKVNAPAGSGVIFVEINYDYHPLFGTMFVAQTRLHYIASFIVRDRRDFARIYNPAPTATASTCNTYQA